MKVLDDQAIELLDIAGERTYIIGHYIFRRLNENIKHVYTD